MNDWLSEIQRMLTDLGDSTTFQAIGAVAVIVAIAALLPRRRRR